MQRQKADRGGWKTKSHEKMKIMVPLPFSFGNKLYVVEKLAISALLVQSEGKRRGCVHVCVHIHACVFVCTHVPVLC